MLPHGLRDLVSGSSWLILAAGLSQGSMLLANLIVANLLGVAGFGRYALIQTTIMMVAALAQLGFAVVIAQQVASLRERDPKLAGEVAAFCFLVTALLSLFFVAGLLAGRGLLAEALFRDRGLQSGLVLAAVALPFAAFAAVQQGLFNGLERFRDQALVSVLLLAPVIALPAFGAVRGGFEGALIGLAAAYALRAIVAHLMIARIFRTLAIGWSLRNLRAKARLLGLYALPATLAGLATLLAVWGGQTLLVRSAGGSVTVGLFAAAYLVKSMVMFVPTQMMGALLPALSRRHAGDDAAGGHGLLLFNAAGSAGLTILLAGGGILLAPWIMSLFGTGFEGGGATLRILLLATPLEALTITLYQDIQAKGRFWRNLLWVNLPLAATVLAAAALLVPHRLAEGLAIAWLIGWGVALAGTLLAMERRR
jgi:O-antigen/teichoic acid export membrane protein